MHKPVLLAVAVVVSAAYNPRRTTNRLPMMHCDFLVRSSPLPILPEMSAEMTDEEEDDDDSVEAAENKGGTADGTSCCLPERNIICCRQHVGMWPTCRWPLIASASASSGRHSVSRSPAAVSPAAVTNAAEFAC